MKKLLKTFIVFIAMATLSMNISVFATTNGTHEFNNSPEIIRVAANSDKTADNSSANVSSLSPNRDDELTKSDIINILLIAVGVVIILLAIAIFIKLL